MFNECSFESSKSRKDWEMDFLKFPVKTKFKLNQVYAIQPGDPFHLYS